MRARLVAVLVVGIGVAMALAACGGGSTTVAETTVTETSAAPSSPDTSSTTTETTSTTTASGPQTEFGDGTFEVGKDVAVGTYRAPGGGSCYWSEAKDPEDNHTINNGVDVKGPTVTLDQSTPWFISDGCGTWSKATATKQSTFGDGTFEVGKDVAVGTYRAPGGGSCYWSEAKDPEDNHTINNNVDVKGPTVTLDQSTPWFISDGCGTWSKIG